MLLKIIIIILGVFLLYAIIVYFLHEILIKAKSSHDEFVPDSNYPKECQSAKNYVGKEHVWKPTFNLKHCDIKVINIPFEPDEKEVFYIENEYEEDYNQFILSNLDLIADKFAKKGFRFIYLPNVHIEREMMKSMLEYRFPQGFNIDADSLGACNGIPSNFLLNYMVFPENRPNMKPGFAWYGRRWDSIRTWCQFDYITFDITEAIGNPNAVFDEIVEELGETRIFKDGHYSIEDIPDDDSADQFFDEETKKLLEEVREHLSKIRLKGVSEAAISRYVKPRPVLSHVRITSDFHIFLDDYNNLEIKMEPIVKAVFILFLRHEDGIAFKDLPDYQMELETIYRAIKQRYNDIDHKLSLLTFTPTICEAVKKLTNPFDNSINEKCTRIKEAFLLHFHDTIAENYYIRGERSTNKRITLNRDLIIWEV